MHLNIPLSPSEQTSQLALQTAATKLVMLHNQIIASQRVYLKLTSAPVKIHVSLWTGTKITALLVLGPSDSIPLGHQLTDSTADPGTCQSP